MPASRPACCAPRGARSRSATSSRASPSRIRSARTGASCCTAASWRRWSGSLPSARPTRLGWRTTPRPRTMPMRRCATRRLQATGPRRRERTARRPRSTAEPCATPGACPPESSPACSSDARRSATSPIRWTMRSPRRSAHWRATASWAIAAAKAPRSSGSRRCSGARGGSPSPSARDWRRSRCSRASSPAASSRSRTPISRPSSSRSTARRRSAGRGARIELAERLGDSRDPARCPRRRSLRLDYADGVAGSRQELEEAAARRPCAAGFEGEVARIWFALALGALHPARATRISIATSRPGSHTARSATSRCTGATCTPPGRRQRSSARAGARPRKPRRSSCTTPGLRSFPRSTPGSCWASCEPGEAIRSPRS